MRSWKCQITGYRDRQRVAISRLETRRFGCLRIDAEREASSRCADVRLFPAQSAFTSIQRKAPAS
jgi:hypothetical protein